MPAVLARVATEGPTQGADMPQVQISVLGHSQETKDSGRVMSRGGYVKLWRKSLDSAIWKNANLWRYCSYCLLKASHREHTTIVGSIPVRLQPGQFVLTLRNASADTGLSIKQVRSVQKLAEKVEFSAHKRTHKYTVVTILKWDTYQSGEENEGTLMGAGRAQSGHSEGTVRAHPQEGKEGKEEEERIRSKPRPTKVGLQAKVQDFPVQVFIRLPLNDGSSHNVTDDDVEHWSKLYPAIDAKQELRNMVGWCEANPSKRKTAKGVKRFIVNWLARAQDNGGTKGKSINGCQPKATTMHQVSIIGGNQTAERLVRQMQQELGGDETNEAIDA